MNNTNKGGEAIKMLISWLVWYSLPTSNEICHLFATSLSPLLVLFTNKQWVMPSIRYFSVALVGVIHQQAVSYAMYSLLLYRPCWMISITIHYNKNGYQRQMINPVFIQVLHFTNKMIIVTGLFWHIIWMPVRYTCWCYSPTSSELCHLFVNSLSPLLVLFTNKQWVMPSIRYSSIALVGLYT